MKYALAIILSVVSAIFATSSSPEPKKDPFEHYLDKVRCTRRYSVGACGEPVVPVWTYVPHLQNCTERLGCHSATISNRFPTLAMCMEKCKALRDMYTLLISETNLTELRSSEVNTGRRGEGLSDDENNPALRYDPALRYYPGPDSPSDPNYPEPSAAPAQLHTDSVVQEEQYYDDVPPEVEFWEG